MATFKFAQWTLHATEIFYKTKLSLGFVNLKPVLPGHVLIIPLRVVPRFADLTKDEITDMWSSAQIIGSVIERQFGGESLTFTIQDGPAAGQTVPHVHIHILPRKKLDFQENDEIYEAVRATQDEEE
eukprot:TRINITY_DN2825_c0_g1_i2.p2 TRINITY_DN2825_c0_g1~~TRINITY_DN2825_c0_g1_i2.p2  ORF type:complete len:127 (-),score=30.37 TRINITY_DN2825_c0_g1_i2:221-601(-)